MRQSLQQNFIQRNTDGQNKLTITISYHKPAPPLLATEKTELSKFTLIHPGGGARQTTKRGELLGSDTHFTRSQFTHGFLGSLSTTFHQLVEQMHVVLLLSRF